MVDDDPLVFYHYSPTQMLPDGSANIPVDPALGGRSKAVLIEHVVNPYKRKLEHGQRLLEQRFPALTAAKSEIRYPPGEPLPAYLTEPR